MKIIILLKNKIDKDLLTSAANKSKEIYKKVLDVT